MGVDWTDAAGVVAGVVAVGFPALVVGAGVYGLTRARRAARERRDLAEMDVTWHFLDGPRTPWRARAWMR